MVIKETHHFFDSDWTTQFRNAMPVAGASDFADLTIGGASPGGQLKGYITSIRLLSLQNNAWDVEFYSRTLPSATGFLSGAVPPYNQGTNNNLIDWHSFAVVTGKAYATIFAYAVSNLKIPYVDMDPGPGGRLHVNLVNQSTSKNPGDSGLVQIRVGFIQAA